MLLRLGRPWPHARVPVQVCVGVGWITCMFIMRRAPAAVVSCRLWSPYRCVVYRRVYIYLARNHAPLRCPGRPRVGSALLTVTVGISHYACTLSVILIYVHLRSCRSSPEVTVAVLLYIRDWLVCPPESLHDEIVVTTIQFILL